MDTRFFGHPRGLATLFFTEMWERFSYYGMRAFLLFYMVTPVANGGLGFTDAQGTSLYGTYTGSAWGAAIVGGLIADRLIGQYRSVLYGGILIMLGHLSLVFHALPFFYTGLALIVIGTGLLKPSVSTLVGSLYPQGDPRRDAGFSIFYMGINSGAMLGPIIAGYVAQTHRLASWFRMRRDRHGARARAVRARQAASATGHRAHGRRKTDEGNGGSRDSFDLSAHLWRRPGLHAR